MRILIYGINYAPELTGIGKYSGEMAEWLADQGHEVHVVTAPPYYPAWCVAQGYSSWRYRHEILLSTRPTKGGSSPEFRISVYRCPLWVPARPSGLKRLVHLASFVLSSLPIMLLQIFWRPHIIFVVEPTLMCAPTALLMAKLCRAGSWLHVQDFEADSAFDMGILPPGRLRNLVLGVESVLMCRFDRVSTISPKMLERLVEKQVERKRCLLFPNWVETNVIHPLNVPGVMRAELNISRDKIVALYSGNMGEKQGLEVVLEAARKLVDQLHIQFVLCGGGAARQRLMQTYGSLPNVMWLPLQPAARLNDLLNLADIHLLPQRADVADLVMPSKLLGMLASGRPVLATAHPGTQLAKVVLSCGKVVEPGNAQEFAQGLLELLHAPEKRKELGDAARQAAGTWDKSIVLRDFEGQLRILCSNY